VSAVYRISMALAILYLLVFLACLSRDDCSRYINENFWCIKIFLVIGLFIGLLYVDNDIIITYSDIAKWVGGGFLIFQAIMLIDLFYMWGERWASIYHNGYNAMAYILICTAAVLYSTTLYLIIKNFEWYPCSTFINIINIIIVLLVTVLTASGISPNGSLITSGAFSIFITFETWSGLNNEKSPECN
jgi:hypothetical protein